MHSRRLLSIVPKIKISFITYETYHYCPLIVCIPKWNWNKKHRQLYSIFSFMCIVNGCLSFCPFSFGHCVVFDLRTLITPLVSSNSSEKILTKRKTSKIYNTRANLHLVMNLVVQNLIITSQQFDVIRPLIVFGTYMFFVEKS
jgi:hypothetical protein